MASRKFSDLHPDVRFLADKFLDACTDAGIDVLVTCTYRSGIEQAALYAQGRTAPGAIVTNAQPGESLHNLLLNGNPGARAFDVVPLVNGRPMWDAASPLWAQLGEIGEAVGLQWGGRWKPSPEHPNRHPDRPHFELKEVV